MSQFFFTPLSFQEARNYCRDRLKEMDPILFPRGDKSLLDQNMSAEEADKALADALESRLGQGAVSGNLVFFAKTFSGGKLNLGLDNTVRDLILSIADNRDLLEREINRHSADSALRVMLPLLCGGAGFLAGRLSASAKTAKALKTLAEAVKSSGFVGTWPIDAKRLALLPVANGSKVPLKLAIPVALLASHSGDAVDSQLPASDDSQFPFVLLALALAALVALAVFYGKNAKKGTKKPALSENDKACDKKQAREILTLLVCLADIYRDKRE